MTPRGSCHYLLVVICLAIYTGRALTQSDPEPPAGQFACDQTATLISAVQGDGLDSPLTGAVVDVEAVVVGVFQTPGELGGLFIEEEDSDQDQNARTSEGLFARTRFPARIGEVVRLRGTVAEFKGLTELYPVTLLRQCSQPGELPTPAVLHLPLSSADDLESIENMRVKLPQTLFITDVHALWQFGELLVSGKRLVQPTQIAAPGKAASKLEQANSRNRLIIDDGRTGRYLAVTVKGQDNATLFSAENPIRSGQGISGLVGVMHYAFGHYRLQPTQPFTIEAARNSRASAPRPVGGTLRVSALNVLNYFSTTNASGAACGPSRQQDCRGAHDLQEQKRQIQKLTAALTAIDADVLALVELENNPQQSLRDISNALNSATGKHTWSFVPSGSIGKDVIKAGLLFKPETVAMQGNFAVLNRAVNDGYNFALKRPALAQSFRVRRNGLLLTVIVTHLKSRACAGATGPDADQGDGQACFNSTRTRSAAALADWAVSDPTGSGSGPVLILGDFNSYRMEDPIHVLEERSLVDLQAWHDGVNAYTYIFDGLSGTLDYAFGSADLATRVTGLTVWHINADESSALDYRSEPGKPRAYFATSPFRSSDHDPIIIGLDMGPVQDAARKQTNPDK